MPEGTASVLVVDDDRAIQRLVADALTQQGFAVTVERDGEWALKAFETKDFDAVVLDLLLPLVNGYEVARRIRAMPKGKSTPILMISGVYRNELHQKEAMEHYGAFAFLEKPFKISALQEALQAALGDRYPDATPTPGSSIGEALEEAARSEALAAEDARDEVRLVEQTARAPDPTPTFRGDLAQTPFPEVLAQLHLRRSNGALLLKRGTVKKIVYFRDGVPQFVKSNLLAECLGRVMVKERLLSQGDCEESLRLMKTSGRQQGAVLIEMGVISPNNLAHALTLQQRVKLFDVFTWRSGQYQLASQKELPAETVRLDMTTAAIIFEGVRRAYDQERVSVALGDVERLFIHPSDDPLYALQSLGLGEDEQLVMQAVDGRKTLGTLRVLDLLSPLDVDRLIYAMRCAGVVELRPAPNPGPSSISFKEVAELEKATPRVPPPVHAPPPLPVRRSGSYPAAGAPPASDVATTRPTPYTANLLQNATERTGPVSAPTVETTGSYTMGGERQQRELLVGRVAAMRRQNHYEVLGVPLTASPQDIHQSYLVLAREFHPDKLASTASAEIRQLTEQIYQMASLAHDTLMDPRDRESYTRDLQAGKVKNEGGEEVSHILLAEEKFQRGEALLRKGLVAEAHEAFSEAVKLYPDEGEFHAYLGWSRFQLEPRDETGLEQGLREVLRGIQLNPRSERAYLFAGYLHKASGRPDLAERDFEKALQVNPGCAEALQELSVLSWASRLGGGKR